MKIRYNLIFILFIVIFWLFVFLVIPKLYTKSIILTDLKDYTVLDATSYLSDNNINYDIIYEYSSSFEKVLYTKPKAFTEIKENSLVYLYVSKESKKEVNDYIYTYYSDSIDLIKKECHDNKLVLDVKYETHNNIPDGIIINQYQDSLYLTIVVNKRDDSKVIKNYVGLNINSVLIDLNEYNILCIYKDSFVDFNIIIGQEIRENTLVNKNNKSNLIFYVSKGI